MDTDASILKDKFGRNHNYLRISLTERCNLRCTYCMPADGVQLSPKRNLMTADEIYEIAKIFVANGVNKIRLTGGEPLVRKDFKEILKKLSTLNINLSITTNGVLVDRYIETFKTNGLKHINISLDTLNADKFKFITRRNQFKKAFDSIKLLVDNHFKVKINAVLIKGFNDSEIIDLIELTKNLSIAIRFIEFMPFNGNKWDRSKLVTQKEILETVGDYYGSNQFLKLENEENFTSKNYKVLNYKGEFGIISSVSNPFCDSCNRIRLTANGKLKNCLFSNNETDILSVLRSNLQIEPAIKEAINIKHAVRAGMDSFKKLNNPKFHSQNRSMLTIGG
ncbi:GTP 3',8-cyclase MoaA [uncultured Winogradskyella sp.]|uniref:GTP 3',8-cyclase MoaA n=1 Tax=uncultured Winogradskyella sp. TaxID=395353 RepID=UPI00262250F7|nr:GTP 3',8-cyclase MoaA [uncultured Winogradskyella sp.]